MDLTNSTLSPTTAGDAVENRTSLLIDPKTPAEYALTILYRQFAKIAEKKLEFIIKNSSADHEIDFFSILGSGVDTAFDKLLNSLGYIARHKPRPVIDTVMYWRKNKTQSHRRHLSDTILMRRDFQMAEEERIGQATLYILARTLIEIVKQLQPEALKEDIGKTLEEVVFKPILDWKPEDVSRSKHKDANFTMFSELIGWLSKIRFCTVSDRFTVQLEQFIKSAPSNMKEQETRFELLLRGMHHLKLKIYPVEALEETAEFLQTLAKFMKAADSPKIKHAYADLFVRLLMPIAGVADAEVRFPAWVKAVEMLFPKAWKMLERPRYCRVAYPLATTLLCVSQREYFINNYNNCLNACIQRFRDSKYRQMAMGCVIRLVWTLIYRCNDGTSNTHKKLDEITKILFPPNRKSTTPPDIHPDLFVQFIHIVGMKHHDYCMKNLIFFLMNSDLMAGQTLSLDYISPERMRIAIRAFMILLANTQESELKPTFPSNPDLFSPKPLLGIKYSSDVITEEVLNRIGFKEDFHKFCEIAFKIAYMLDRNYGGLLVLDEKIHTLRINYSPIVNVVSGVGEINGFITHHYLSVNVSYPKEKQPSLDLLREYVNSLPRLINDNTKTVVEMLCRYTAHADPELAKSSFFALIRIAHQCGAEIVITGLSHFVNKIEDQYTDILTGSGSHSGIGAKSGGVLRLYLDLLVIWLGQLRNNKHTTDTRGDINVLDNSTNITTPQSPNDSTDSCTWTTIIEVIEANGLLFLCSQSSLIRKCAINILQLVADLEVEFEKRSKQNQTMHPSHHSYDGENDNISEALMTAEATGEEDNDEKLEDAKYKLHYSASGTDDKQKYSRIIHVLKYGGGELIKFDTELQNSLTIVEHIRLQKLQQQGKKDILLRLVESENPADAVIWSHCFPTFMKICIKRFHVTVPLCRSYVLIRIMKMQSAIVSASEAHARPAPKFHMPKSTYSANDDIIKQWSSYLIVACSTITVSMKDDERFDRLWTNNRNRGVISQQERITSAKELFRKVLPLLSSEHREIRNSVWTALGNINEFVYRTLLEELGPHIKAVEEDYRIRTLKQGYASMHKRGKKFDRLRTEIAHVFQLTAHFLLNERYIRDSSLINIIISFIKETKQFLQDGENAMDWEWQKLRTYFCGLIEKLYDGISQTEVDIMDSETRAMLFKMIEEWCGHGKRGSHHREREARMLSMVMDQFRDAEDRRPLTTQMEADRKALEFAALNAMASLCKGPVESSSMKKQQQNLLDSDSIFEWIQSVFENPQDKLHPIARRALEGLLISNKNNPSFLEVPIHLCYSGNPQFKSTQGYFLALTEVFSKVNDYPCERPSKILSLALFKVGDAELEIRKNALKLLKIIENRYWRETFSDEFEVGITSELSSIYKQTQILLSTKLAQLARKRDEEKFGQLSNLSEMNIQNFTELYEETHFMLSEVTMRFEFVVEKCKKDMLAYLVPWVRNVELHFTEEGELHPTTFIMISNLFFITVKYGDMFVKEIKKIWQQLVMGEHVRNIRAIVKFLIDVGLEKRNPIFVSHAKRVFVYLGRTPTRAAVIEALVSEIIPKSMSPQSKETGEQKELKTYGMHLSKIEEAMPQQNKRPIFSSGQLAMLYMVDMAIEAGADFELHLPRLLHVLFVQLDSANSLISEETRSLLINLIHSMILSKSVYPEVVMLAKSLVKELRAKESSQLWPYEDITYNNRSINSLVELERLLKDVVTIFGVTIFGESNQDDLKQMWGEMALKWATSCAVRHIACRSFQIFRFLIPVFNEHMLTDVLSRLSNTISDASEDIQGFALEILITLSNVVDWLEKDTKEIFPQLIWATIACLQTVNEQEFLEVLSILDKILDKYDLSDEENSAILRSFFPEHKWHGQFIGIQPLLMKGILSSTAYQKTFYMLKKLLFIQNEQLIDPTPCRLMYLILANLPRFVHALDDESIREECNEWALYLSEMSEQQDRTNLAKILSSYHKGRFRSKEDFLRNITLIIRENYFNEHQVEIIIFFMSLLSNKLPYCKLKTMTIIKTLLPYVNTENHKFISLGSELILPLLRLLQTEYSQEALEVLDEAILIVGGPKDKQILRMSFNTRRGKENETTISLFGEPEESGWSIPDRNSAMEMTRNDVHSVCYTCKVSTILPDPDYQFFADIPIDTSAYGDDTPTRDYKFREIVSKLQDLNEYFLPGDDVLSNGGEILE
ncbi:13189_t:CDS:10 [Entrophospora sp. SA101]|nr:13189_t:CDS:10 [Entrophospora sp. SA101]